jgi:exonuclease-1
VKPVLRAASTYVLHRKRTEALAKANSLLAEGKTGAAREHYIKACDVSPQHAYQLIKELRREGIDYCVAPYEADSQLAYLEKHGLIDGIITEDSDLIVFGCRTVLYKLNADAQVVEFKRDRLASCREYRFDGWSELEFRQSVAVWEPSVR